MALQKVARHEGNYRSDWYSDYSSTIFALRLNPKSEEIFEKSSFS